MEKIDKVLHPTNSLFMERPTTAAMIYSGTL